MSRVKDAKVAVGSKEDPIELGPNGGTADLAVWAHGFGVCAKSVEVFDAESGMLVQSVDPEVSSGSPFVNTLKSSDALAVQNLSDDSDKKVYIVATFEKLLSSQNGPVAASAVALV